MPLRRQARRRPQRRICHIASGVATSAVAWAIAALRAISSAWRLLPAVMPIVRPIPISTPEPNCDLVGTCPEESSDADHWTCALWSLCTARRKFLYWQRHDPRPRHRPAHRAALFAQRALPSRSLAGRFVVPSGYPLSFIKQLWCVALPRMESPNKEACREQILYSGHHSSGV